MTTTAPARVAAPAVEGSDIKLGLTLYSLTSEWAAGWYDLAGLLDVVDAAGIGPGIEIVASQTLPHLSRRSPTSSSATGGTRSTGTASCRARSAQPRHGPAARPRHDARRGVRVHRHAVPQRASARLPAGAHPERQAGADPPAAAGRRGARPHARLGDPRADGPELARRCWRSARPTREIDSPLLGFVADFSSTMHSMSPTILRELGQDGPGARGARSGCRRSGRRTPTSTRGTASSSSTCTRRGIAPESLGSFARLAFNMHGHVDPAEWADIMPQIMHVHAKFYDIDEHGDEPAIDYPATRPRCSSTAATAASSPASGRATPSPNSARSTRSSSSASSTTSSAGRSRPP